MGLRLRQLLSALPRLGAVRGLTVLGLVLLFIPVCSQAQRVYVSRGYYGDGEDHTEYQVSGRVYGSDEFDDKPYPLPNASVRLICLNDTASKGGSMANKEGSFTTRGWLNSKKLKKKDVVRVKVTISYTGYKSYEGVHTLTKEPNMWNNRLQGYTWRARLDSIVLQGEPMTIKEVEVMGELSKMFEAGDTTVFNVDAFQMPRGSVLLNLIRRMPGLRYEDGVLTYNDSTINEIRLNGESFFKHDMKVALENIENADLKQFKIYHAPTDTTDANSRKQLVADMITKKPTTRTSVRNLDAGTATKKKTYLLEANGFDWYSGNRGEWNFGAYLRDLPSARSEKESYNSVNLHLRKKFGPVTLTLTPDYNYSDSRGSNESLSATYMPGYQQYSQRKGNNRNYNNRTNQRLQAEGNIGKRSNWNTSANFSYNDSRSHNENQSATYRDNPFREGTQQLISEDSLRAIALNRTTSQSHSRSHSHNLNWRGRYSTRFGADDKNNVGVNFTLSRDRSHSTSEEIQRTDYLQYTDSVWAYHRQAVGVSASRSARVDAFYNRKLGKMHSIRLSQLFSYRSSDSDRDYFDMERDMQRLDSISTHTYNMTRNNQTGARLYLNWEHFSFDVGADVSLTDQAYEYLRHDGVQADTAVTNLLYTPSLNSSWRYTEHSSLTLAYQFQNRAPGLSQLVTPTSNDNPLYVQHANPNLRKELAHSLRLDWRINRHLGYSFNYSQTQHSISSRSVYDTNTGGVVTTPENINGNWNIRNGANYTLNLKHGSIDIRADYNFRHNVSYVRAGNAGNSVKGLTRNHDCSISPVFRYFTKLFDLHTTANYNYQTTSYDYMDNGDSHHSFSAELIGEVHPGDRWRIGTTARLNGQFGYQMSSANRTDFIWNLSVEYKCLKNLRGTIKLNWYDILQQQRTYYAYASSTGWTESRTSGTPSYATLAFSYRFYKMR